MRGRLRARRRFSHAADCARAIPHRRRLRQRRRPRE
jgi:hypothetical protein